jgi:hypothetical protein
MTNSRTGVLVLGTLLVVGVLATLIYMSIGYHQYEVELCITFKGRRACGTAAGANREEAMRAAANLACSSIASGMSDDIACGRTEPDSIRWITE